MALLITIMTLSLIFAITVQYHRSTWQKFAVSHNHRVGGQLRAIAGSGVEIALALLEHDGKTTTSDSLLEVWASIENEDLRDLFPAGTLQLAITDLSGRLQINSLVQNPGSGKKKTGGGGGVNTENEIRAVLLRLLLSGAFAIEEEDQARRIVDALVDWIDGDDRESDFGAENGYYRSLDPPYSCKNGPVDYIEELLLVAGITPELLFGSAGTKGLAEYLTVYGDDGKINISTAPLPLIRSLDPLLDDELVGKLDEFRRDKEGGASLDDPAWYKNVDGWPGDITLDQRLLTATSSYFHISATGLSDTLAHQIAADVERENGGRIRLLAKKVE
jgi:general secretion pathway protein K